MSDKEQDNSAQQQEQQTEQNNNEQKQQIEQQQEIQIELNQNEQQQDEEQDDSQQDYVIHYEYVKGIDLEIHIINDKSKIQFIKTKRGRQLIFDYQEDVLDGEDCVVFIYKDEDKYIYYFITVSVIIANKEEIKHLIKSSVRFDLNYDKSQFEKWMNKLSLKYEYKDLNDFITDIDFDQDIKDIYKEKVAKKDVEFDLRYDNLDQDEFDDTECDIIDIACEEFIYLELFFKVGKDNQYAEEKKQQNEDNPKRKGEQYKKKRYQQNQNRKQQNRNRKQHNQNKDKKFNNKHDRKDEKDEKIVISVGEEDNKQEKQNTQQKQQKKQYNKEYNKQNNYTNKRQKQIYIQIQDNAFEVQIALKNANIKHEKPIQKDGKKYIPINVGELDKQQKENVYEQLKKKHIHYDNTI